MRARGLVLFVVVGCSGPSNGEGGAGGTTGVTVAASSSTGKPAVTVASSTTETATSSSTTAASSSSTGTACLNSTCAKGTECGPAGGCIACPDATTCATCFPSDAEIVAACNASPGPHIHCTSAHAGDNGVCIPPNQLSASFLVWCNWDATESCAGNVMPGDYCRDMDGAIGGPKAGSRVDPP